MIEWVDIGLSEWAEFFRDDGTGLGYPSCSAEARVYSGGGGGSDSYVPDMVALIEEAVLSMDDDMRSVVKVAYMSSDNRAYQAGLLTQKLGRSITRRRLTELLDLSHQYIEGYSRCLKITGKKY